MRLRKITLKRLLQLDMSALATMIGSGFFIGSLASMLLSNFMPPADLRVFAQCAAFMGFVAGRFLASDIWERTDV